MGLLGIVICRHFFSPLEFALLVRDVGWRCIVTLIMPSTALFQPICFYILHWLFAAECDVTLSTPM
ncbi:hypothetical protein TZ03_06295 [Pseudomonas sp. 10-1B]|nr:hypothetical protein TZ03_06295 [Pseudomonas sp. 10-1B]